MSDHTWELQQYVEAHPENHDQRWRLAKRLYKEGEYRATLEHLQILTNELEMKPNLIRYHAATLTRLNRPTDAVNLLEKGSREWPEDAALLEQLAIAYARAGNQEDAASIWGDLAAMVPDHRFARRAQTKILEEMNAGEGGYYGEAGEYHRTVLCSRCGTMNTPDSFTCRSCTMRLDLIEDIVGGGDEIEVETPSRSIPIRPWVMWGLMIASVIYGAIAMNAQFDVRNEGLLNNHNVYVSWSEFAANEFLMFQIAIGVLLIVTWPLILHGAMQAAGSESYFAFDTVVTGCTWATFAFALSWIPGVDLWVWLAAVLGVTLVGTLVEHRESFRMGMRIWVIEMSLAFLLIVVAISAIMGPTFLGEIPRIDEFAQIDHGQSEATLSGTIDDARTIRTRSSGSTWIDERSKGMALKLEVPAAELRREMTLQIIQNDRTLLYERVVAAEQYFDIERFEPGVDAMVELLDGAEVPVTLTVRGVLPVEEL